MFDDRVFIKVEDMDKQNIREEDLRAIKEIEITKEAHLTESS